MAYKSPAASTLITGVAKFDSKDVLVTSGLVQNKCGLLPSSHNLGITYAAGTFTICSASQASLSATNPGYVTLQSKTAGKLITVAVTANQDFIDDVGASQIIGNLFGMPGGAYASDIPFYLYAILKEDESAVAFACARVPNITSSPAVAKLGRPSDATAGTQGSMFIFEDVTLADYDLNPVLLIGSFRMQISAADDWTVSALNSNDGIGRYQETNTFAILAGKFGAAANTVLKDNAGTAPVFTTNANNYYIYPNGNVWHEYYMNGDAGTDGAGAVNALMAAPIIPYQTAASLDPSGAAYIYTATLGASAVGGCIYRDTGLTGWGFMQQSGNWLNNSVFGNGARILGGMLVYRCSIL